MQELFEKRPDLLRTQDIIYISLELNLTLLLFRLPFTACLRCYSISQFLFLLTIISIILGAWHWLLVNFLYLCHHKIIMLGPLLVLFSFILCEVLRDDKYCRVINLVSWRKLFIQSSPPLVHLFFPAFEWIMILLTILDFGYYSYHVGPKFLFFACKVLIGGYDILNCSIKLAFLEAQNKQVNLWTLRFHTSCHVKNLLVIAWGIRQSRYIDKVYQLFIVS